MLLTFLFCISLIYVELKQPLLKMVISDGRRMTKAYGQEKKNTPEDESACYRFWITSSR